MPSETENQNDGFSTASHNIYDCNKTQDYRSYADKFKDFTWITGING